MGAKSYSLKTLDMKTGVVKPTMKMKGLRFNYKCDITPDTYYKAVHGDQFHFPQCSLKRDRNAGTVHTVDNSKVFRSTFTKRLRLANDYSSLPFGWVSLGDELLL